MKFLLILFLLLFSFDAVGATLFQDDFNDGNIAGWTGMGYVPSAWQASGNMLKYNGGSYVGTIAFIGIDSVTTPSSFVMEADINISPTDGNLGHIGFFWGYQNGSNFNTAYMRTHSDHITHFSYLGGSQSSESYLNVPNANNSTWYHMKISVDYTSKTMTTQLGALTQTFTGATFDTINRNSGGKMGVITWGEVGYFDNVVITTNVPEPATFALLLSAGLLFLGYRKSRR